MKKNWSNANNDHHPHTLLSQIKKFSLSDTGQQSTEPFGYNPPEKQLIAPTKHAAIIELDPILLMRAGTLGGQAEDSCFSSARSQAASNAG